MIFCYTDLLGWKISMVGLDRLVPLTLGRLRGVLFLVRGFIGKEHSVEL